MSEYEYYSLTAKEISKLFSTLPECDGNIILLHKGCSIGEVDEEDIFDVLQKGWSVVV